MMARRNRFEFPERLFLKHTSCEPAWCETNSSVFVAPTRTVKESLGKKYEIYARDEIPEDMASVLATGL